MKVAVVLNTNQLGGAERSLVEQCELTREKHEYHILYPRLPSSTEKLHNFLTAKRFLRAFSFDYPAFLYRVSRKGKSKLLGVALKAPLLFFYLPRWGRNFSGFDLFYLNGTKAALPLFFWSIVLRKPVRVIWHFRDFPAKKPMGLLGKYLPKLLPKRSNLTLVANSHAVERDLLELFPGTRIKTLYNLPGTLPARAAPEKIRTIGVVSMIAPWKGLHEVVLMAALYEKELRALGIKKFVFYGESIYQTEGEHQSFAEDLRSLARRLGITSFIEWAGQKPPATIFSEIDLLIHSSIRPEPFGRVIVEAFKTKIPVISTALGGASELVEHRRTGLVYSPGSLGSLYDHIRSCAQDNQLVTELTSQGYGRVTSIESSIPSKVLELF